MERGIRTVAVSLALAFLAIALVLPVGVLVVRSFQVQEVTLPDGRVERAAGEVTLTTPREGDGILRYDVQAGPTAPRISRVARVADGATARKVWSLQHYRVLLGDRRTLGLVKNSAILALGAVVFALLLGLPLAWWLYRTNLPGRHVLRALTLGPMVLPPLFLAMGGARPMGGLLYDVFGLSGAPLQLGTAMLVFGFGLFPLVTILVGRALAEVPAGPTEAAYLFGGRRAAFSRVVLPAVLPAVFGAATLVFVLAVSDFAVPDTLSYSVPHVTTPAYVFPTEILLQFEKNHNTARAVATGAPLVLITLVLLAISLGALRSSPVVGGGEGRHGRPPVRLSSRGRWAGWSTVLVVLTLTFVLPIAGVLGWAFGSGSTSKSGTGSQPTLFADGGSSDRGTLFDFSGAIARTPGVEGDIVRWIKSGLGAAILATLAALVLVRWALRSGPVVRAFVLFLVTVPLAVPGLVFTVGTRLFWLDVDWSWADRSALPSMCVLAARFLPFAALAVWLALRQVRPGHEDAAALLGAEAGTRARRIWLPLALPGILLGALTTLLFALRETDAVVLVDPRILPMRIYSKIHFSRLADEANLALIWLGVLLVPAVLAALVVAWRHRRRV